MIKEKLSLLQKGTHALMELGTGTLQEEPKTQGERAIREPWFVKGETCRRGRRSNWRVDTSPGGEKKTHDITSLSVRARRGELS